MLLPITSVIGFLIYAEDRGKIVFKQKRSGRFGRDFYVYKFRTMYGTKTRFKKDAQVVTDSDERVTRVGAFLRKFKLDELPQLINVLKGEMSLVGPRPLLTVYKKNFERWEFAKFAVRPGLTGLAQVKGNGYLSIRERSYYDVYYANNYTIFTDLSVILKTFGVLIFGEKRYVKPVNNESINVLIQEIKDEYLSNALKNRIYEKPLRVAQVVGNAVSGGVSRSVLNYYRHIDRSEIQFDFYTYSPSPIDDEIKSLGGNVYYIPNFINFLKATRAFYKLIRDKNYFAVHSGLTSLSVFPLFAAKKAGVKTRICHAHSTTAKGEKTAFVKNFLRRFSTVYATALCACGVYSAEWLFGARASEAVIIHNAIDLKRFRPDFEVRSEVRKELGIENSFVIGNIGRFEYQKNQSFLLEILDKLKTLLPNVKLVIVGSGKLKERFRAEVIKMNLARYVIVLDDTERIERLYNAFDVFVLPSYYEGLPIVGIEAQATGLECLFSNGVTNEVDVSGHCIFLPLDDVGKWTKEIERIYRNRVTYRCTENLIERGYEIQAAATELKNFYEALASGGGRTETPL